MLVALQSFTCDYDGRRIAVHRGRTFVAADHELAGRYPHRFAVDEQGERAQVARMRAVLQRLLADAQRE